MATATKEKTGPGGVPIRTMIEERSFLKSTQVWQGPPKVGKTSTSAALEVVSEKYSLGIHTFHFLFEKGSGGIQLNGTSTTCPTCKGTGKEGKSKCGECNGIGTVRYILKTRKDIREWFQWFADDDHYNVGIIDTLDGMYQVIMDDVCVQQKIVSPFGADDHGIAWAMIADDVRECLGILTGSNKALIIIAHVYMQTKRVRGGGEVSTATFNVSGKSRQYVAGLANQILHFDVVPDLEHDAKRDKHVVIASAQSGVQAGDQWGLFPDELDLGDSPEEGAEAILTAFGMLEDE